MILSRRFCVNCPPQNKRHERHLVAMSVSCDVTPGIFRCGSVRWLFTIRVYTQIRFLPSDLTASFSPFSVNMPKRCVVGNCSREARHGVNIFSWPRDPATARKWDKFVQQKRSDWTRHKAHSTLCSIHFRPDDFVNYNRYVRYQEMGLKSRLNLKKDAVPSVNVPDIDKDNVSNDKCQPCVSPKSTKSKSRPKAEPATCASPPTATCTGLSTQPQAQPRQCAHSSSTPNINAVMATPVRGRMPKRKLPCEETSPTIRVKTPRSSRAVSKLSVGRVCSL